LRAGRWRRRRAVLMGMPLFVAAFVVGAAAIALWVDFRFPGVRPSSWGRLGVAVAVSFACDDVCGAALGWGPRLVSVMGIAFPAIAATLLVCIWMLRMARASMPT
jgi:hypothetical protein